ncbi:MAG: hypothetical protein JWL68_4011 [Actinomycetia bacterium]|nr:hypothetical protein [Actinomycetes bacterium]
MSPGAGRGTILIVPILLLLAGVVILAGVVAVAMGRGGEMTEFAADSLSPALDGVVTAADVAMLRPPSSLWGYNMQATDEALTRIAQVITERDVEIAVLRQQLAEFRAAAGSHPAITATLLARSKAAAARADKPGREAPPRRGADPLAPDPGPAAGSAGNGSRGTDSAGPGLADTGSAGMGSAGMGSAGPGSAGPTSAGAVSEAGAFSEEAAASRDD